MVEPAYVSPTPHTRIAIYTMHSVLGVYTILCLLLNSPFRLAYTSNKDVFRPTNANFMWILTMPLMTVWCYCWVSYKYFEGRHINSFFNADDKGNIRMDKYLITEKPSDVFWAIIRVLLGGGFVLYDMVADTLTLNKTAMLLLLLLFCCNIQSKIFANSDEFIKGIVNRELLAITSLLHDISVLLTYVFFVATCIFEADAQMKPNSTDLATETSYTTCETDKDRDTLQMQYCFIVFVVFFFFVLILNCIASGKTFWTSQNKWYMVCFVFWFPSAIILLVSMSMYLNSYTNDAEKCFEDCSFGWSVTELDKSTALVQCLDADPHSVACVQHKKNYIQNRIAKCCNYQQNRQSFTQTCYSNDLGQGLFTTFVIAAIITLVTALIDLCQTPSITSNLNTFKELTDTGAISSNGMDAIASNLNNITAIPSNLNDLQGKGAIVSNLGDVLNNVPTESAE